MRYNIRGEKVEITPSIRSYIEDKIGKLDKYFENPSIIDANVVIKVRGKEQKIEIKDNALDIYELTFTGLGKENKLNIDIEKGSAYYEVITEYYVPYDKVDTSEDKIEVSVEANESVKVNEVLQAKIRLINRSDESIYNGMVTINIPQGFTVQEESLMRLESRDIIEKYEISYTSVNLYLSDFEKSRIFKI